MAYNAKTENAKLTNWLIAQAKQSDGNVMARWLGGSKPQNFASKHVFGGMNIVRCQAAQHEEGFSQSLWVTFPQALALGGNVIKGETSRLYLQQGGAGAYTPKNQDLKEGEKPRTKYRAPVFKAMFNVEQCEGFKVPPIAVYNDHERLENCENFFNPIPIKVIHEEQSAYFSRARKLVNMPIPESFESILDYYSTLGHEETHYTALEEILNRPKAQAHGDSVYAFEEIIAETGAAFIAQHCGIGIQTRHDSADYLANWIQALESDYTYISKAASKAQSAFDWLAQWSQKS
jgi:antirestriction protein ArdC